MTVGSTKQSHASFTQPTPQTQPVQPAAQPARSPDNHASLTATASQTQTPAARQDSYGPAAAPAQTATAPRARGRRASREQFQRPAAQTRGTSRTGTQETLSQRQQMEADPNFQRMQPIPQSAFRSAIGAASTEGDRAGVRQAATSVYMSDPNLTPDQQTSRGVELYQTVRDPNFGQLNPRTRQVIIDEVAHGSSRTELVRAAVHAQDSSTSRRTGQSQR